MFILLVPTISLSMLCGCLKVRRGEWKLQSAVFKVWDLGDSLEPIHQMRAEVSTYSRLKALQACVILANACVILASACVIPASACVISASACVIPASACVILASASC